MKQLIRNFKLLPVLILAISLTGCEEDDVVLPQVIAGFTYTIDPDTPETVKFINISENAQKYEWRFGDETDSTEIGSTLINPIKTYAIGPYTISLTAINVAGDSHTFEDTIIFLDQDAPLITLIGDATINVTLGDTFTDPGATALDEVDGDLTANIIVGGDTVDTNVEGTYTITYDVSDSQGNAATQVERTVNVTAISCDDETAQSLGAADFNLTFLSDPGTTGAPGTESGKFFQDNVTYEYADNPDVDNDLNKSCKVGKVTKSGVQPWDNLQIEFDDKFTFTDGDNFTIKVFSPVSGYNVSIKLEDKTDGGIAQEVASTTQTTKTNEWEELTIPFGAGDSGKFDKLVIFFDVAGPANTNVYYFDDLKLNSAGGGGGGDCVAETMQSLSPASDFNLTFMSDPGTTATQGSPSGAFFQDNVTYEYVDNPDFSMAENNSCKVGKVTKSGVEAWDNLQIDFDDKFAFTDGSNFTIKVYSPVSGYNVTLKLEDKATAGGTTSGDRVSTTSTTKTNEWEELSIPFGAGDSGIYDRLVIFFDLEGPANTNVYYIDDLKLNLGSGGGGGGGGGDCPPPPAGEFLSNGDFEAGESCWQLFDGASISTTFSNGGSNSAEIQGATGVARGIKQERFAVGSIQPNTSYTVTFDIIADGELGVGGLIKAFTFSEGADGGTVGATQHVLTDSTTSISTSSWETMSFTFTTPGNANQVEGGLSFLIELVNSPAKLNIDNVSVTLNP